MNYKVIAIVGLAAVLAVSGGVIAATSSDNENQSKSADTSSSAAEVDSSTSDDGADEYSVPEDYIEASDTISDLPEPEAETEETNAIPTSYDGTVEPSVPYEEQLISASMTVKFVVDHSTGAEAPPRVVFGEGYSYCYAAFDSDGTFEMCIDPASGAIRTGTYRLYDNIVAVQYSDGVASEYDILTDEYGNITHIIVNYGDYDVYFG